MLILILLHFSPNFRPEYRIRDFVFTIWRQSQGLNLKFPNVCLCLVAGIFVFINR